jgi:hypothetical protein
MRRPSSLVLGSLVSRKTSKAIGGCRRQRIESCSYGGCDQRVVPRPSSSAAWQAVKPASLSAIVLSNASSPVPRPPLSCFLDPVSTCSLGDCSLFSQFQRLSSHNASIPVARVLVCFDPSFLCLFSLCPRFSFISLRPENLDLKYP